MSLQFSFDMDKDATYDVSHNCVAASTQCSSRGGRGRGTRPRDRLDLGALGTNYTSCIFHSAKSSPGHIVSGPKVDGLTWQSSSPVTNRRHTCRLSEPSHRAHARSHQNHCRRPRLRSRLSEGYVFFCSVPRGPGYQPVTLSLVLLIHEGAALHPT